MAAPGIEPAFDLAPVRCFATERLEAYDDPWRRRFGGMLSSIFFNRRLYEWGGYWACRYLAWRVTRATDPRRWLRRFNGSSRSKVWAVGWLQREKESP